MSRVCESSGKHPRKGGNIVYHGIPKYLGGIGLHVRGRSKRFFKPNLQEVRVELPNGQICKMKLATSEIRNGIMNAKVNGKRERVPIAKAPRGLQKLLRERAAAKKAVAK
ncbi:MAG TPA: L28 family ribosomal protein [Planctomycetota bacterium]|nr:L28 family ribosomal protein [Planctomycetota bacterium]